MKMANGTRAQKTAVVAEEDDDDEDASMGGGMIVELLVKLLTPVSDGEKVKLLAMPVEFTILMSFVFGRNTVLLLPSSVSA